MLCRFSFVGVSFGMCYIYAACARKVRTRVHFSLRNHIATFITTTIIIIVVDEMCAELVCIRVRACSLVAILSLSGTVVRWKGISCTAYCAITTNHTATSKADSGSWLQKAPLPLVLCTFPPYPRAFPPNLPDKRNVGTNAMQHDKQSKTKQSNSEGTLKRKEWAGFRCGTFA